MLEVFSPKNKKEEQEIIDKFTEMAKQIYDAELKEVMDEIENEVQRIIYLDWWYGGSLWEGYDRKVMKHIRAKRYAHVSDHDWDEAGSWILQTCSRGMG